MDYFIENLHFEVVRNVMYKYLVKVQQIIHLPSIKKVAMRKIVLFWLVLISPKLWAQPNYSITSLSGFENPVDYSYISGSGVNLVLDLYNSSDDDESENLAILYLTEEMILQSEPPAEMQSEQLIDIPAESFLQLPVNDFQVNTDQFRVGGNIVVIWPSYVDPLTDTLEINVTVNDTLVTGYKEFLFHPETRDEVLRALHSGNTNVPKVDRIEVYNLKGQLVKQFTGSESVHHVAFPNCILLVRVYTDAGTYFSFVTKAVY
jgi:hypothetical protein